ncbi:hypothetical protein AB0H83_47595 [Dactylosporangium sp. NPDC050688]|uniref:hypothetical protein n=1 Tax=Dactylosporangium sp. NPDC050688 TaxID=3157217 RepID=UPI003402981E
MVVTRGTRWIALVLAVLAVGVIALAMVGTVVVTYQPWRFLAFVPFERQPRPVLIIGAGVLLLGVAGWLGLRSRAAVRWASAASASAVLILLCVGFVAGEAADAMPDDEVTGRVDSVAKSPDGRFELVARPRAGNVVRYRLRTTGRLLGRESQHDLACTAVEPSRHVDVPTGSSTAREIIAAVRVEHARFVDGSHVELRMTDGRTWAVGFDAGSLRAERYLDWCGSVANEPR